MASNNCPTSTMAGFNYLQFSSNDIEAHYSAYFKARAVWEKQGFGYIEPKEEGGFEARPIIKKRKMIINTC